MHKFTVGQSVDLLNTVLRPSAAGAYEIRHLVPAPDGHPENPRYRIKNIAEKHERVASESELTLSGRQESIFSRLSFCEDRSHHGRIMALNFPNASRSYDSTRHAVRFWGYDSAMETSFFVVADALRHLQPGIRPDEESLLQAFDSNRELICAAATKVYKRGNKGSYELGPTDF